jgi:hypothetical protein
MSELRDVFGAEMIDTVHVRTYAGRGMHSDEWAEERPVEGVWAEHKTTVVRNPDSTLTTSTVTIVAELELEPVFAPQSRVRLGNEQLTVLGISTDSRTLPSLVVTCA